MDRRSIAIRAGLGAPPLALVAILLATILDPSFSWTSSALSHTGELPPGRSISLGLFVDRPSFLLFNGGLIVAGLLGLPFAWLLYDDATHPLQRSGAVLLALTLVTLAGVGVFHLPHGLHAPFAITHFILTMAFLLVNGLGTIEAGDRRKGAITMGLGLLVLCVWMGWTLYLPGTGIAIPEFVGALALGGWIVVTALEKLEEREREAAMRSVAG